MTGAGKEREGEASGMQENRATSRFRLVCLTTGVALSCPTMAAQ
jgi:hypothetical protein